MIWLLFSGLLSCAQHSDSADPTPSAADAAFVPELPTAQCGMPSYSWLSTESMGSLLAFDDQEGLSFEQSALASLVGSLGVGDTVGTPQNGVETFFVRYQTQDRGEAVEATGMIVVPDAAGEYPVLLWLHPTMGFSDACAPTATGLTGAAFPLLFASMGFVVVAPDYLGMSGYAGTSNQMHPYIVGEPTAIASIDALRALDRLVEAAPLVVTPRRDRLVLWGASQGGFAALWADRYLPHYAPHYEAVGSIATIPATDMLGLGQHAVTVNGPTTMALAAAQITMNEWYRAGESLDEIFVEGLSAQLTNLIATECEDFSALEDLKSVEEIYTASYIEGITNGTAEPWTCFLTESTLRERSIPLLRSTPTLMVLAEDDDLAIASYAREDATALCAQGYRIEYVECAGVGHVDGAVDTLQRQLTWAQDRAVGLPWDDSAACVITAPQDCSGN